MAKKSDKLLTDKESITDYIDIKADHLIDFLMRSHLPVLVMNGRWYAHKDNLDEFMRRITMKQSKIEVKKNGDCPPIDYKV